MTDSKTLPPELLDTLLSNYQKPEDLIGENGLLKQLTKALIERALAAEMTEHLGHAKHEPVTTPVATPVMAKAERTSKAISANCRLRFRAT